MAHLPPYEALADRDRGEIYGLMATLGDQVLAPDFDFAWERDRALLQAVDASLVAAAEGRRAEESGPPRWLDGLVHRQLADASRSFHAGSAAPFVRIRLLQRLDLIQLAPDDTYVLAMVGGLGPGKVGTLKSDPELIQHALWRVFEVEGGGEVSLTNVDRFGGGEWRTAFLSLSADGTLDRARVLAACLEALRRDFLAYRAAWFTATFLALEPTLDEVAHVQHALRRLLGAPVPATVSFAVKQLQRLQKAGRLDLPETLTCLPPATLARAKGTALDALRLARVAGPEHHAAAAEVARAALGHQHADVQRAAAELLATCGGAESVAAAADDLAPSVRDHLGLGVRAAAGPTAKPQQLAPVAAPVTDADLAERTAALLEDASDVGELEAVLAALVEPGREERLAPLRKRATSLVARGPSTDLGDWWLAGQLARLVLSVLGESPRPSQPDVPALRFLTRRFSELRQTTGPLLATPDLPGGWVSAGALVERLAVHPRPRHHDLVAALLRLHPDGRDHAVPRVLPDAVRFALDGVVPKRRVGRARRTGPDAWWVAADRSRAAYGDIETPRLHGEVRVHRWREGGRERQSHYGRFAVSAAAGRPSADDLPTELGAQRWDRASSARFLGDWIPSLAGIWPHDAEHFLAITCMPVLEAPNWTEAAHDVPRVLDALARHPGRLGTLAAHTLAAGLSASRRDHRLHAVDAFLDLVPTGRIAADDISAALAKHQQAWPLTRWAESLGAAARGPGGSDAVLSVLVALLPRLPLDARGLNRMLDLLRDETLRAGRPLTEPGLLRWLERHSGSSATARTARLLLG